MQALLVIQRLVLVLSNKQLSTAELPDCILFSQPHKAKKKFIDVFSSQAGELDVLAAQLSVNCHFAKDCNLRSIDCIKFGC